MISLSEIDFAKLNGLIPACIQDGESAEVLMIGFMNQEALERSIELGLVTFWSRTRQALWTKGETSGNVLHIQSMSLDCDRDSLLIQVKPSGPTCHNGTKSCFPREALKGPLWYSLLEERIASRLKDPIAGSYTSALGQSGVRRIAQKIGEEGLEVALAAVSGDDDELINEFSDLLFHSLVMLKVKGISTSRVTEVLKARFDNGK
jgi:phosphoribosyl-ATP pyrophosphohydrolase/phosphoribosyl-AMP cyclohydrolase